jgi:phosphoribosylglycinamide formyltransferase-1
MKAVILISGRGSNMQALLEAGLPVEFACVISNRPDAAGLDVAARHGVATAVIDHRLHAERPAFDAALAAVIDRHAPDVVILAGFMRVLSDAFVRRYLGRMINIHPALLPAFPGLNTHQRALDAGVRVHGCTVHFVTPEVDSGPIIAQAAVPVLPGDSAEQLAARVLAQEHRLYPRVLGWLAAQRVSLSEQGRVVYTGLGLRADGVLLSPEE